MENNQENKKGFFSISKGLVFILLVVLIIFLVLYIWRFHYGLSSDQLRWSQFGDFFNGVVSPIFAAINICIFWYLTNVIDLNNDKRQKEKVEHEKAIILMQFRKAEIDKFEECLTTDMLIPQESELNFEKELTVAASYVMAFQGSKLDLFGLDKESDTAKNLQLLKKYILVYIKIDRQSENYDLLMKVIILLKIKIVSDLQKITLGEKIS